MGRSSGKEVMGRRLGEGGYGKEVRENRLWEGG